MGLIDHSANGEQARAAAERVKRGIAMPAVEREVNIPFSELARMAENGDGGRILSLDVKGGSSWLKEQAVREESE